MGFADLYLERYGSGPVAGLPEPDPDLFLTVILPAYREPNLETSLNSLLACDPPGIRWEILVHINYPEGSSTETVAMSDLADDRIRELDRRTGRKDVRIFSIVSRDVSRKYAGVGFARKVVMDLAVSRFNRIGRKEGIIVSFDADSTCEPGFLRSITGFYRDHPKARTANLYFEHPLQGPLPERNYRSIAGYELYLRYMRLAIRETGHPHAIHTVGSSFSVRASAYVGVNGMGRDKAGEDFYFLHKCVGQGQFWEINSTVVVPSARESDRVIFGTGASVQRLVSKGSDLEVYQLDSFGPLRDLFLRMPGWWSARHDDGLPEADMRSLHPGLSGYLNRIGAAGQIRRMIRDSAGPGTYRSKFFAWFNNFQILRYLNTVHGTHYYRQPVAEEAGRLARRLGINSSEDVGELLEAYRDFERTRGNIRVI